MSLFQKHQQALNKAVAAISERSYYAAYPEHPKAYAEDAGEQGKAAYEAQLNNQFVGINSDNAETWIGEEVSPYTNSSTWNYIPLMYYGNISKKCFCILE